MITWMHKLILMITHVLHSVDAQTHTHVLVLHSVAQHTVRIMSKKNLAKGGEGLRQELLERLIDCRLMGATGQVNFNSDPTKLAMRELPHGSWSNVFLLYMSYVKTTQQSAASRSTFFSVCQRWKACLRFHKKTQHQICETCSKLKSMIRNSKDHRFNLVAFCI